jgi:hypothetical protein
VVNSFENIRVQLESLGGLVRDLHYLESISKSLNSNSNRSVSHVRVSSFLNWVVVYINNSVKIFGHSFRDFVKVIEVEFLSISVGELGEGDGGQIADSNFIFRSVLNNFSAEVGALNAS